MSQEKQDSMTGSRIRERRIISGWRQTDLARQVGISPSYLNLIEHNRRRIGGRTLVRLAEALGVEPAILTAGAEAALLATLREAAAARAETPDAAGRAGLCRSEGGPEMNRIEEFAGRFPGWARLLADLHRRTGRLERTVGTLTDRLAHDPHLADSLHAVISAVTAIRATASILVETEALEPEWQARFLRNVDEDSARLTEDAQALVRYLEAAPDTAADITVPQDEMHAFLAASGYHFPELETVDAGSAALERLIAAGPGKRTEDASQPGDASQPEGAAVRMRLSPPAQHLLRAVLEGYLGDAQALPLAPLSGALAEMGPDPQALAARFGASLPQVFRRLAMLPEALTGPIGLVICDGSGAFLFRKPFPGFDLPRAAGGCTLWPLYQVLAQPRMAVAQRLVQAGRGPQAVRALAAAEQDMPTEFGRPPLTRAHMLLLPDRTAREKDAPTLPAQEVGLSCGICPVQDCAARREPSILAAGL